MRSAVVLCVLLAAPAGAVADGAAGEPLVLDAPRGDVPDAGVADLAWLAGHWTGTGLGGTVEETWAPPAGGAMMGAFRLLAGGEVGFYEMMLLLPVDGRLTLRLKHFDAALRGWEEAAETVDFPLVDVRGETWYFAGLTIARRGADAMTVHVRLGDAPEGEIASLSYTRAR